MYEERNRCSRPGCADFVILPVVVTFWCKTMRVLNKGEGGDFSRYLECVDSVAILIQSVHKMHGGGREPSGEDRGGDRPNS